MGWVACMLAAIAAAAIPYFRSLSRWTEERRQQASRLADLIAGHHNTRPQLHPLRRANRIDASWRHIFCCPTDRSLDAVDAAGTAIPTLGSVATLVSAALANDLSATGVAVSIGATLLGARALNTTVGGLAATF